MIQHYYSKDPVGGAWLYQSADSDSGVENFHAFTSETKLRRWARDNADVIRWDGNELTHYAITEEN